MSLLLLLYRLCAWLLIRWNDFLLQLDHPLHQFDEVGHLVQLTKLRRLRNESLVIKRLERVLILELGDEEFQEIVLPEFFWASRRRGGRRRRMPLIR